MRSPFAKWKPGQAPPRSHVIGHRLLGPPVSAVVALFDAARDAASEFTGTYRQSYRATRSWHADQWTPGHEDTGPVRGSGEY